MKNLNIKSAVISAVIIWVLGVTAFVASYFLHIMEDPETQANWVLSLALIPAVSLGAYIYYRKGYKTNALTLGVAMFLVTIILDALITVPVFIAPYGGNHASFFGDITFWVIGLEYITLVSGYRQIEKSLKPTSMRRA
ncbi:MAG: DUF5367 family protein [Bacteroidota bacterium]